MNGMEVDVGEGKGRPASNVTEVGVESLAGDWPELYQIDLWPREARMGRDRHLQRIVRRK
jgi:hypothetical protein